MFSNYKNTSVGGDLSAQSKAQISAFNAEFTNATYRQSLLHCSTTDIHVSKFPSTILKANRSGGFTLVELILVIIILGIVSIGTVQYLSLGAQIYAEATERDEAVAQSRFMLARLTRELRHATPHSVRLNCDSDTTTSPSACSTFQCLEFVPFKASSIYVDNLSSNQINIVDPVNYPFATANTSSDNVSIYALSADDLYKSANNKRFVINSAVDNVSNTDLDTWTMSGTYAQESPTKRVYVLDNPVSFCVEGSELYRYEGYGFKENKSDSNPNIATHTIGTTKGILLGQLIQNDLSKVGFFNYHNASLTRNSVVNIHSEMGFNDTEVVSFNHEIHLPNVP